MKPKAVFTSGGFVAVPTILAAKIRKIPIIAYESDSVAGISNKIAFRYAKIICLGYKEAVKKPKKKQEVVHTGTPIRSVLLKPNHEKTPEYLDRITKPILFFMGGSQGAKFLNDFVEKYAHELTKNFFIIHQHGPTHNPLTISDNYIGYSFIREELPFIYEKAGIVISRAGSVIAELASFKKSSILVPIPESANNHQYHNAKTLAKAQAAILVQQSSGHEFLYKKILELEDNDGLRKVLSNNIYKFYKPDAAKHIAKLIRKNI